MLCARYREKGEGRLIINSEVLKRKDGEVKIVGNTLSQNFGGIGNLS